jgi:hypothetical protein
MEMTSERRESRERCTCTKEEDEEACIKNGPNKNGRKKKPKPKFSLKNGFKKTPFCG